MNLEIFDKHKMSKKTKIQTVKPFVCQYCGTGYSKESTLLVHNCEKKRRHLAKNEKHVQLGYSVYVRFFQLTQNIKGDKSYEDFVNSPYYNAFVRFGSFLSNVDPLYPMKYIDWIVTSGIKLDHWCNEDLYYKYVLDFIKKETAETALKRSIETMIDWADSKNSNWAHYFKYVSQSKAIYDIRDGKMSPWVVLNCTTGKNMLKNFTDEQLGMITSVIDPSFWSKKFKNHIADVEMIKALAKENNL